MYVTDPEMRRLLIRERQLQLARAARTTRSIPRALALGIMVAVCVLSSASPAAADVRDPGQAAAITRLKVESSGPVEVDVDTRSALFATARVAVGGAGPEARARAFLARYHELYGVDAHGANLDVKRAVVEPDSQHVVFDQSRHGRKLIGGEIAVHLRGGVVVGVNGAYLIDAPPTPRPRLDAAEAAAAAKRAEGGDLRVVDSPQLSYFDADVLMTPAERAAAKLDDGTHLVWDVTLDGRDTSGRLVSRRSFLDAVSGAELLGYSLVENHAPAEDLWIRTANLTGGGLFCTYPGATDWFDEHGVLPGVTPDAEGDRAFTVANTTYDYFYDRFHRHSYDDAEQQVRLILDDAPSGSPNAAYVRDCNHFVFNDGMATKDVVAHEYTHAVTRYTADLLYLDQSGALNESFSDVFAALIDSANWTIGEGSAQGALRSLEDPPSFGDPDHMTGWVAGTPDAAGDWGGVHSNSGIPNKVAFLLADGGTHYGRMIGAIGRSKLEQLWYSVLTSGRLTSSSGFLAMKYAAVAQASEWAEFGTFSFTSTDVCNVRNAFASVGLGAGDIDCDGAGDDTDTVDNRFLWAYVWANNPTAASYTPSTSYQRNATGALNTISRSGVGSYAVIFANLGTATGGTVHVTAYGPGSAMCKVAGWGPALPGMIVNVRCFDAAGARADSLFTASFTKPVPTSQFAYVWANAPLSAAYIPSATYQFNSTGAVNSITRQALGKYQVRLPGLASGGGTVEVTAYGSDSESCRVTGWGLLNTAEVVDVACQTAAGAPADAMFTMSFHGSIGLLGTPDASRLTAYAWANQPTSASYTPSTPYQFNAARATNTITRLGVGVYQLRLPGLAVPRGHVNVTAMGAGSARCKVSSWAVIGGDEVVNVRCFDVAGSPTDAQYVVNFVD
jgi:Zn-dependent metalloprotease